MAVTKVKKACKQCGMETFILNNLAPSTPFNGHPQ